MDSQCAGIPSRQLALALGAVATCLAVAACGSTGLGTATDEAEIVQGVTQSFVDSDPAHCRDLYTQSLMDQMSDGSGQEAVDDCLRSESDRDEADAERVEVSAPTVSGSRATATAHVFGGDFDQAILEISLVEGDSGWKLDRLEDVDFRSAGI